LTTGDESVRAGEVRAKARELLGRDSESLSDRNFPRILKDAHDGDVIDLRRRGDDFEIARAADAESVSAQLAKTAAANAPAVASIPAAPRGMGPRGGGRGRPVRPGTPPAGLLSIGVVGPARSAVVAPPTPVPAVVEPSIASGAVAAEAPAAVSSTNGRKTRGRKPVAKRSASVADAAVPKVATRKTAAKKSPAAKKTRARKPTARAEA
jgi:hypothetical protein